MKPLQVDEKAVSVGEPQDRSGWSLRVMSTAGGRRLKEVRITLPDPQTKAIDLCSIPLLGKRE
jgi:3'-phosphoadenosine 5'-phosphosulfate sulfotransferase